MNKYGNSYSSFFQIVKTSKDISTITDKISDRLIITKQGELYFDYSDNERIKISNTPEHYKTDIEFISLNETVTLNFSDIKTFNNEDIKHPVLNTLLFDIKGNMGMIINVDDLNNKCDAIVLAKNVTAKEISDIMTIKRFE